MNTLEANTVDTQRISLLGVVTAFLTVIVALSYCILGLLYAYRQRLEFNYQELEQALVDGHLVGEREASAKLFQVTTFDGQMAYFLDQNIDSRYEGFVHGLISFVGQIRREKVELAQQTYQELLDKAKGIPVLYSNNKAFDMLTAAGKEFFVNYKELQEQLNQLDSKKKLHVDIVSEYDKIVLKILHKFTITRNFKEKVVYPVPLPWYKEGIMKDLPVISNIPDNIPDLKTLTQAAKDAKGYLVMPTSAQESSQKNKKNSKDKNKVNLDFKNPFDLLVSEERKRSIEVKASEIEILKSIEELNKVSDSHRIVLNKLADKITQIAHTVFRVLLTEDQK